MDVGPCGVSLADQVWCCAPSASSMGFRVCDRASSSRLRRSPPGSRLRSGLGRSPAQHLLIGNTAWPTWRGARRLAEAAARLDGLFAKSGLEVIGGTSLFRLVRTRNAAQLFQRLG
jgi:cobalamin biosynthetic protein CobC